MFIVRMDSSNRYRSPAFYAEHMWGHLPTPSGETDSEYSMPSHHICGCVSFEQFEQWWPHDFLHKCEGLILTVYYAEPKFFGEFQVTIDSEESRSVSTVPYHVFSKWTQKQYEENINLLMKGYTLCPQPQASKPTQATQDKEVFNPTRSELNTLTQLWWCNGTETAPSQIVAE